MSDGKYLRKRHYCLVPRDKISGDVWQCSCGRRWTARTLLGDGPYWHRRYWPWPR